MLYRGSRVRHMATLKKLFDDIHIIAVIRSVSISGMHLNTTRVLYRIRLLVECFERRFCSPVGNTKTGQSRAWPP